MTEWLKDCEICNAGLCAEMDNLISTGLSARQAAREMAKTLKVKIGNQIYTASMIRDRYRYHTGKRQVEEIAPSRDRSETDIEQIHRKLLALEKLLKRKGIENPLSKEATTYINGENICSEPPERCNSTELRVAWNARTLLLYIEKSLSRYLNNIIPPVPQKVITTAPEAKAK